MQPMILKYGDEGFDANWLSLLSNDPVHPTIAPQQRINGGRTVLAYVKSNVPQCFISVKISRLLPHNTTDILSDEETVMDLLDKSHLCAVFYSIFRLKDASKGSGVEAIHAAIDYCRALGFRYFYTLSPIPKLREDLAGEGLPIKESRIWQYLYEWKGPVARFHLSNGAKIHSINFAADNSPLRERESWGIMVNYDYCDTKALILEI